MRWVGYVALMGERRGFYGKKITERVHLENPGVDWMIIVRLIFRKWDVGAWTGSMWLTTGDGHL
jgi:hypothetical protein